MQKINKNLAKICEIAYEKGFKDAIYLMKKYGEDTIRENLKEGIKSNRKNWIFN